MWYVANIKGLKYLKGNRSDYKVLLTYELRNVGQYFFFNIFMSSYFINVCFDNGEMDYDILWLAIIALFI